MPALFPMMSAPEDFRVGDCVRKFVTDSNVSPFTGIVTHIVPSTYKVWVQWPTANEQESPETLIKVNPLIYGMPTVHRDLGYSSYEKSVSEKLRGCLPKRVMATERMALRIAHTFAIDVVGKLIDDIVSCHDQGMGEVQTYNRVYQKYATICSDYIVRSSVQKVYEDITKE